MANMQTLVMQNNICVQFIDLLNFQQRFKRVLIGTSQIYPDKMRQVLVVKNTKSDNNDQFFFASSVHFLLFFTSVMYLYYSMAALGLHKYLWWKKYLTQLQLAQFVIFGIYGCFFFYNQKGFPSIFKYLGITQPFIFFYMFYSFYRAAYRRQQQQRRELREASEAKKEESNGHIKVQQQYILQLRRGKNTSALPIQFINVKRVAEHSERAEWSIALNFSSSYFPSLFCFAQLQFCVQIQSCRQDRQPLTSSLTHPLIHSLIHFLNWFSQQLVVLLFFASSLSTYQKSKRTMFEQCLTLQSSPPTFNFDSTLLLGQTRANGIQHRIVCNRFEQQID